MKGEEAFMTGSSSSVTSGTAEVTAVAGKTASSAEVVTETVEVLTGGNTMLSAGVSEEYPGELPCLEKLSQASSPTRIRSIHNLAFLSIEAIRS